MKKRKKLKKIMIYRFSILIISFLLLATGVVTFIVTYSEYVTTISPLASGVVDNIVYLNDLESDFNYYMGQNYTYNNGVLPTLDNKNVYSNNNLVKVQLTYNGSNPSGDKVGFVSVSERQNKYIYYKYYPVNNNGTANNFDDDYVEIELIDNPFTDRPVDMAFNGWLTTNKGATIRYDSDYYVRYVKVPVTYNSSIPVDLHVNLFASWTDANVSYLTTSNGWSAAFDDLLDAGMSQVNYQIPVYENLTNYYFRYTINRWSTYPNGAVDAYGDEITSYYCADRNGCTYYLRNTSEEYDPEATYYLLDSMYGASETEPSLDHYETVTRVPEGSPTGGYFRRVVVTNGNSVTGFYNNLGVYQSGNCSGTCEVYELIQYLDSSGNVNVASGDDLGNLYFLVTRDTNIIVLSVTSTNRWSDTKPFTLTSVYNGNDLSGSYYLNVSSQYIRAYSDTVIENIQLRSNTAKSNGDPNPASGTTTRSYFYGYWFNNKIGRGITTYGNYVSFNVFVGGSNGATGSNASPTKYRFIIESGLYNTGSLTNGSTGNSYNLYTQAQMIYGNDYDRATGDNDNLIIYGCAAAQWGSNLYSGAGSDIATTTIYKSGTLGNNESANTVGSYVGGRQGGTNHAARLGIVEGGYIYNLIGGPLTATDRSDNNDTYIYVKGGTVYAIWGGAGRTETYGNRIVQVTGGLIEHSVFGGSNANGGSEGEGTVTGDSFVYIGGNAVIGSEADRNVTYYGSESGSVFGNGAGKSGSSTIGSNNNANVIIDGNAVVTRNVYGGGNFGSTGISSSFPTTTTNMKILGGTIRGSVYGGGNNNGSGSSSKISTINIEMTGGNVLGSVYGGSRQMGIVYGTTNVNVLGGTIGDSVYGGGEGGYTNNSNQGTFVSRDVNVKIGNSSLQVSPVISGNVYGGSAYGTVNGTTISTTKSSYGTNVEVNKGTVSGSVFGGGKGSTTFTPYVEGDISVIVNDGTINNVFGGNDASGTPNGSITVTINGGNITNTFGGGNLASVNTANVYLKGGTSTNIYGGGNFAPITTSYVYLEGGTSTNAYGGCNMADANNTNINLLGANITNIFGGSNQSGTVTDSHVSTYSGTATTVYGGNNSGGVTTTTGLSFNGGTIGTVYGGGNLADTGYTWVGLYSGTIGNVYGGGEKADITGNTNVYLQGAIVSENVYGGSNVEGNVPVSNISATNGSANTIYGGNNQGGITSDANVTINGASVEIVYGGGRLATVDKTVVNLLSSTIKDVYGGGESADITDSTNVYLKGSNITGNLFGGSNTTGSVPVSNIEASSGSASYIYGGNNLGGTAITTNINLNGANVIYSVFGGGNVADTSSSNVNIVSTGNKVDSIFGGGNSADVISSNVTATGGSAINIYGGSNTTGEVTSSLIKISSGTFDYIYGSNNQGGITTTTNIDITGGTIKDVYGGGNFGDAGTTHINLTGATIQGDVYGGGNQAKINSSTDLNVLNSKINGSIYGGGNFGVVSNNTDIYVSSSNVSGSVYAGGNGASAIVNGNTLLNIDGSTVIDNHVFGGGNAAATGTSEDNTSEGVVNIAGATIGKNVYGGANTSVLYGTVLVNIGQNVVNSSNLIPGDIQIGGTVFGGGEANASGSDNYDYSFISVTVGITINIDAQNHNIFNIGGSIFGSGNASSTTGYSYIMIKNYGSEDNYKTNISIQRANRVTLDNSAIELSGATDRTNEYSTTLFTLSRIDELKLINSSTLYLQTGANLLKKFSSLAQDGAEEVKASVSILDDGSVTKNVNNKVYMYEGKNLNIATNESVTAYGEVSGMTFFGMYSHDRDGKAYTALYDTAYSSGEIVPSSIIYFFNNGSYVLGLHSVNHNYKNDGFYSNFEDEDSLGKIKVDYITPTPEDSNYYMWVIGETVASYDISLTASKFSTLGTYELPLINFSSVNTMFSVVGFNYNNLNSEVSLVDDSLVPRVASSGSVADNVMSLVMKTSNSGWITRGKTVFLSDNNYYEGTVDYASENSTAVPSLLFYLYHSKNLSTDGSMGSVTISLIAVTPIDDLNNKVERININVDLSRALYSTNEYEGTITAGKEYAMFAPSLVNITSKSSFSTYYSLFAESEKSIYKEGYHRVLTSTYNFPANTKITMIDFLGNDSTEYYYYVVTEEDRQNLQAEYDSYGEVSYNFSKFVKMGSPNSNNNYNDSILNLSYYDDSSGIAEEEFIFIVDFSESNIEEDVIDKSLFVELRNDENQTLISVIGIQQDAMKYSVFSNKDALIDVSGTLNQDSIYIGESVNLSVNTSFVQNQFNLNNIYDTNYFDYKLGVKLTIIDEYGNVVNGASLMGVSFMLNGVTYYPRFDGTVRINIAERVANVSSNITINTKGSNLASGDYKLLIESFGSPDGIYYGLVSSDSTSVDFTVNNTIYGLNVNIDEKQLVIDKATGYTQNGNNVLVFNVDYESGLKNPNLRISLYRRDYTDIYTNKYNLVDIKSYFTNDFAISNKDYIYILERSPLANMSYYMYMKENLVSGTYKVVFSLYDNDTYIGDVYKYIIIK